MAYDSTRFLRFVIVFSVEEDEDGRALEDDDGDLEEVLPPLRLIVVVVVLEDGVTMLDVI